LQADSSVSTDITGLLLIDGYIEAAGIVDLTGGSHSSGAGIVINPLVLDETGDEPVRISGGTVNSAGGNIKLTAIDDIVIHGTLGDISEAEGVITADSAQIEAISTGGNISVTGYINVSDSLTLSGMNVFVFAGGSIKARGEGGSININA